MKKVIFLLVLCVFKNWGYGQNQPVLSSYISPEITVCGDNGYFEIKLVNATSNTLSNPNFTLTLPTGIVYETGSLVESTSYGVTPNGSGVSQPQFNANSLPAGDSIFFEIQLKANLDAVSHQQLGNVFRNVVELSYGNQVKKHTSAAFNVLYAALNILSVNPSSINVITGDTFTRSITIINAGNGKLSSFSLSDIRNGQGLELIDTDLGRLNSAKDAILFSAKDFQNMGNNDGFFNTNEKITITQTLTAQGCVGTTISSILKTSWGCNSQLRESLPTNAHATISLKDPNLRISSTSSLNTCFSSQQSSQIIELENNGLGYATNVTVDIYKSDGGNYNQDLFSAIDPSSVTYKIGTKGTRIPINPSTFATRNDGPYSCLGNNPVGRIVVNLPISIPPGTTIFIEWNSFHCCISECQNQKLMGWKYQVDYGDMCGNQSYSSIQTGETGTDLNMTLFTETPTDIKDGETLPFVYTISSFDNNLPVSNNSKYEVLVKLPNGLDWSGNSNDLIWSSSPVSWSPSSLTYNSNTRTISALYDVPEPFNIQKSEIKLMLTGNCTNANSGNKSIELDINYIPDNSCISCKVEMVCSQLTTTNLHCPIGNCEGLHFLSFSANRINFGSPDNNSNGLPDTSGKINHALVKSNRLMVGDTLETVYRTAVKTGVNNNQFHNFYVEADIDFGQNLDVIDGEILIFTASTQAYFSCTNFQIQMVNGNGSSRKFRFSFLPNSNCSGLPNTPGGGGNFYFSNNDSITFKVRYRVSGNIGANVEEVTILNDLFTSSLSSPWGASASQLASDKWSCDNYNARFTLIGYFFDNQYANKYTVKNCTKILQQSYQFSVGDCCDNFDGGNLFPYEYRNWAHIKEVRVQIPVDYEVLAVYFDQKRTKTTNQSITQTVRSLTPFHNSGGNLHFDLEQHYKEFGGNLDFSDDGFSGTVYIELAPTCDVPVNTFQNVSWEYQFVKNDIIGGGTTPFLTANPDRVKYRPTSLNLTSSNPRIDGLGKTVQWNLNVKNTTSNSSAANSWVHFKSPSNGVQVQYVIDIASGDTISLFSDYFKLGTINASSSKSLAVIATYSGCAPDQIVAYSGYECAGYPSDFAHFYCNYSTYGLWVEPKNAEPQVTIQGKTVGNDCSDQVEISIEVASVRFAHLDNIEVEIEAIGNGMSFITGSGQMKYPVSNSFYSISDPILVNGKLKYQIKDLNPEIQSNGLVGIMDVSKNRFQLKFQMALNAGFKTGDFAKISVKSQEICGRVLPQINLAYDPSIQFQMNALAGLSNDLSSSWGIAWGDYDNDGFDDVYISEYDKGKGSYLYHNNGNGTFSKQTSGPIVAGKGSAIAATWGDYNNDGNLDLFVANNVGEVNALYKNIGNGNFSRITTGDIANYGGYCHGASWVDYDNDGFLDLFVTDYMPTRNNVLYRNNGDETFTQITNSAIVQEAKYSIGATWADYDNDGDMDVFVPATRGQANSLFRNDGAGSFNKMSQVGIPVDSANSVGCSWGDYDNDGDLDLFVTNTSGQNNFLYQNDGNGTFTQVLSGIIVNDGGHSSSSNWVDFDNDGDLDLYVCNDHEDRNNMYINDGNGNFSEPESPLSENLGNSYSQAWSDYDNDGDLDVLVGNHSDEKNVFFDNNRANCNSWICLRLIGINSNRSGIGARISIKSTINGKSIWQTKEISAQTGGGAGSQNSLKSIFGLGDAGIAETIIVQWPSGYRQVLTNQSINTCLDITEGNGMQVCGTVFHDKNSNCTQDIGEEGIPGVQVKIEPGNRVFTTNQLGAYEAFLEPGAYVIQQSISGGWSATCSSNQYQINVTGGNVYCGNNFGNVSQCGFPNLNVTMGTTALRKGFRNEYTVLYGNSGAYPAYNVELHINFDDAIVPISSSTPWSFTTKNVNSITYTWIFDTLNPLQINDIRIIDSISVQSNVGDELTVSAHITDLNIDCDTVDNTFTETNPVVGAIDPNDLAVYPKGDGEMGYIEKNQVLRYKIRFQNVGTYFAQNVYISNQIPVQLDPNSITQIVSSHDYEWVQNGRKIEFIFKDICLPDSSENEPESNGFIEFNIAPLNTVQAGENIKNVAEIVFDYEDPLITNEVLNTIKYNSNQIQNKVLIQPNPVNSVAQVMLELSQNKYSNFDNIIRVDVYNSMGQLLVSETFDTETQQVFLDAGNWKSGCYMLRVFNEEGQSFLGKMIKK